MFNQELADKIVEYLNSCFPDKVQFDDLRAALSEFSTLSEEEWLRVLDALEQDGRVDFKGIRTGFDNTLKMVANVVVSNTERRRLAQTLAVKPVVHSPTPTDPDDSHTSQRFERAAEVCARWMLAPRTGSIITGLLSAISEENATEHGGGSC